MTTNTTPNTTSINIAFGLAGFEYGTPLASHTYEFQPPDNYAVLVRVFDSTTVLRIANEIRRDDAFLFNLAAALLEHITNAGYTVTGRQIELESYTIGEVTFTYPQANVYRRNMKRNANILRAMGRRKLGDSTASATPSTPSNGNPSNVTGVTASEVEFAVTQHASLNNAHHNPPDVSNLVTQSEISDFQTESQVDSIVAMHTSDVDAHHIIPDTSEFLTESEARTLINSIVGSGTSGLTSTQVNALIAVHAALPNVHHTPPSVSGGGSGITQGQVEDLINAHAIQQNVHHTPPVSSLDIDTKIADHAALANVHHTQPILSGYVTETDLTPQITAINTRITNAINQIGNDITNHANLPNVHHTPPSVSGGGSGNPKMVKTFTALDNTQFAGGIQSPILLTSSFPTISENTTGQPRFFRVTLNGGRFINKGLFDNTYWYGFDYSFYYLQPTNTSLLARIATYYWMQPSWFLYGLNMANRQTADEIPAVTQEAGNLDVIIQQPNRQGVINFRLDVVATPIDTTPSPTRGSTVLTDWAMFTHTSSTLPVSLDTSLPLTFTIERLDNLATSL